MPQYIFMGCSSTARAKGRNWFVKKSCLPLTIDLIFLLEIKLISGETEEKKQKKPAFTYGLYICCINLKREKKNCPISSHCSILIKLGQALENLLVLKLKFFIV